VSDPRILYDAANNRWIAAEIDFKKGTNGKVSESNGFLIAASDPGDPTKWKGFRIPADPAGKLWADFPTIGMDKDVVVLTGSMKTLSGQQLTQGTQFLVLKKDDLYQGAKTILYQIKNEPTAHTGFPVQPVVDMDNKGLPEYMLSASDVSKDGSIRIPKLVSTSGGGITLDIRDFTRANEDQKYDSPPSATQPDVPTKINTGSESFSSTAELINGKLWVVESVLFPREDFKNGRSAIRWIEIAPAQGDEPPTILQSGVISDPKQSYYYGSIAVDSKGNVVIGFSGSSVPEPSTLVLACIGGVVLFCSKRATGRLSLPRRRSRASSSCHVSSPV
jgi:hypothetical protein